MLVWPASLHLRESTWVNTTMGGVRCALFKWTRQSAVDTGCSEKAGRLAQLQKAEDGWQLTHPAFTNISAVFPVSLILIFNSNACVTHFNEAFSAKSKNILLTNVGPLRILVLCAVLNKQTNLGRIFGSHGRASYMDGHVTYQTNTHWCFWSPNRRTDHHCVCSRSCSHWRA